ncbi:MAG: Mov34/MPN/PAD-1 family protein [Chloroflexi bacterium]|nr:Mov34/MPN/PAD-1 family protein [Chloroflexota bacterium]
MFVDYLVHRNLQHPPALPPGLAYGYALAGNGVWKLAANRHVTCQIPALSGRVAGLPDLTPRIELRIPRLPGVLLTTILLHARQQSWLRPTEALYRIEVCEGRPRLIYPPQQTGQVHVAYEGTGGPNVVVEIHSHHEMGCGFSGTDNRDEKGFRFYGVIGHIYTRPQIRLRLGVYGDFYPVPVTALFTSSVLADTHAASA